MVSNSGGRKTKAKQRKANLSKGRQRKAKHASDSDPKRTKSTECDTSEIKYGPQKVTRAKPQCQQGSKQGGARFVQRGIVKKNVPGAGQAEKKKKLIGSAAVRLHFRNFILKFMAAATIHWFLRK